MKTCKECLNKIKKYAKKKIKVIRRGNKSPKEFLAKFLADGPKRADTTKCQRGTVFGEAKRRGYTRDEIYEAAKELTVHRHAIKVDGVNIVCWKL